MKYLSLSVLLLLLSCSSEQKNNHTDNPVKVESNEIVHDSTKNASGKPFHLFHHHALPPSSPNIEDFISSEWTLMDSAAGDLNNDKRKDYALVLENKYTYQEVQNNGKDTIDTKPRLLLIVLSNKQTNEFYLAEQTTTFIFERESENMEEPFQSIEISKGILKINFQLFYNMGSWYVTSTSYKFRYQSKNNEFVLIGADNNSFHRATHDFEDYSYDFLNKKWSRTTGNDGTEETEDFSKTEWFRLEIPELRTFRTFERPYTWEVTKDVYL